MLQWLGQTMPATRPEIVNELHLFLTGSTFALYVVAAMMFVRFYRKTGDRLFLYFAAAFGIFSLNRLAFFLMESNDEVRTLLYVIRLVAFGLIIYAIVDKNRKPRVNAGP